MRSKIGKSPVVVRNSRRYGVRARQRIVQIEHHVIVAVNHRFQPFVCFAHRVEIEFYAHARIRGILQFDNVSVLGIEIRAQHVIRRIIVVHRRVRIAFPFRNALYGNNLSVRRFFEIQRLIRQVAPFFNDCFRFRNIFRVQKVQFFNLRISSVCVIQNGSVGVYKRCVQRIDQRFQCRFEIRRYVFYVRFNRFYVAH